MKILVAMSGGVDSTVSAYLLADVGHHIEGVYMKTHDDEALHVENIRKVKKVCEFLGIKYHILDLKNEFKACVYDEFVQMYKEGKTPNPCVTCNRNIKFGKLLEFAKNLKMDKLATGHYVQIQGGLIKEALDKTKDQSYFLSNLKKEFLQDIIFPLGGRYKKEIKEFAKNIEILNEFATQKESSEICFVPNDYTDILGLHVDINQKGDVLDSEGKIIGEHKGYMHYTIGKRKGFTVWIAHEPHYVLSINAKNNTITVGKKNELLKSEFEAKNLNIFTDEIPQNLSVKVRYRSRAIACSVAIDEKTNKVTINTKTPISALAKGQLAVLYSGDLVIASAEII